jgi:hypothetical protein
MVLRQMDFLRQRIVDQNHGNLLAQNGKRKTRAKQEFTALQGRNMTEREFFVALQQKVRETGEIGDVFPCMVEWNVPRFLLSHLWPDVLSQFQAQEITGLPLFCYAASETGWNQRIQNMKSRAEENGDGSFTLHLNKAWVMQAEMILLLLRLADDFCLALIPFSDAQKRFTLIERDEPHTVFHTSDGNTVLHYRLSGTAAIDSDRVHPIKERNYSLYGVQIPAREITGLALLAAALADRHDYRGIREHRSRFQDGESLLLSARENRRLSKNDIVLAMQLIEIFAGSPIKKHALWKALLKRQPVIQ